MGFSSVPLYLDPPNWQQQQQQQQQQEQQHHHHQQQQQQQANHLHHQQPGGSSSNTGNPQLPLSTPPPPQAAGGMGSIRPGSMADRARMAKIPQPEMALKCPRCESTNTKFCYFNNYSLTQPRHFCKTCRRYWTRGGALRNVPVGGGCRRNKRSSKSSGSSKSPATAGSAGSAGTSTTSVDPTNSCTSSDMMMGHIQHQPPSQLPNFMASLHHQLISDHYGAADQLGFSYGGIHHHAVAPIVSSSAGLDMEFNMGISSSSAGDNNTTGVGGGNLSSSSRGSDQQWRFQHLQQFPFMAGLEQAPQGLYPLDGEGVEPSSYLGQINRAKPPSGLAMHGSQMPSSSSVKMEENQANANANAAAAAAAAGLNLSRQFLGSMNPGNDRHQYLGSNAWTNLSSAGNFTSSSSTHLL